MQLATKQKKTAAKKLSEKKNLTTNKAGGVAFTIDDPAEYLLNTIGSSFFSEPKYYAEDNKVKKAVEGEFNTKDLDEQAVRIVQACIKVSESENPRDVLALANWARSEMHIRTTPCVMTAVAAKCHMTKPFVRKYVPKVAQRPDDIKQIVAAYQHLFGNGKFPASLKKGVADAMSKVSEQGFLKYSTEGHPSWKDLLLFCERKENYPVSKALFEYLVNDKVISTKETPIIAAYKELTKRKIFTPKAVELAKKARVTWEVLVSQFGNKKEVWEAVIPQMGYMALLRNLRNFIEADVGEKSMMLVCEKLANKEQVLKSRQMPFRFFAAHKEIEGNAKKGSILFKVKDAVSSAMDTATENLQLLKGDTLIAVDVSGSMSSYVSGKSQITCYQAAAALGAMAFKGIYKAGSVPYLLAFSTNTHAPSVGANDSVLTIMNQVLNSPGMHGGTDAHKIIDFLVKHGVKVDRIFLFSDMQCYNSASYGMGMAESFAAKLKNYRMRYNSQCFLHSVNLSSQDNTALVDKSGNLNNLVSGFHHSILEQCMAFEQGSEGAKKDKIDRILPSLEYIRENY